MKYLFISLLAASVSFCNNMQKISSRAANDSNKTNYTGNDSAQDNIKNQTLSGKWFLQPALPSDTASGKIPTLDFDLTAHHFNGNTGCNSMNGSFTLQQSALSFNENIMSTKMACPGYNEKVFLENLLKTNNYQIKNGTLQLMYNTTVLSNWVRKVDTTTTKQI